MKKVTHCLKENLLALDEEEEERHNTCEFRGGSDQTARELDFEKDCHLGRTCRVGTIHFSKGLCCTWRRSRDKTDDLPVK